MMKDRGRPSAGEFYRHFKGNLYQVIGTAKHSETGETLVVYQALYGEYGWYVRPLEQFLSPVDREKYPEAKQEWRFERVIPENAAEAGPTENVAEQSGNLQITEEPTCEPAEKEETVREEILRFLDAETATEKLKVLRELRMDLDESLLTTMELSLDLVPDDRESMERRVDLIERTLEARISYEGGRFRQG